MPEAMFLPQEVTELGDTLRLGQGDPKCTRQRARAALPLPPHGPHLLLTVRMGAENTGLQHKSQDCGSACVLSAWKRKRTENVVE